MAQIQTAQRISVFGGGAENICLDWAFSALTQLRRRASVPQQIIKLFRGIKIADVPVEQPTKFELVINLKTAKAMGVTVSPALLLRADRLIE